MTKKDDYKVVNVLDLNKDGTVKSVIPGLTGLQGQVRVLNAMDMAT